MSDEWKIVQGLKKQTQNNSFGNNERMISEEAIQRLEKQGNKLMARHWSIQKRDFEKEFDEVESIDESFFSQEFRNNYIETLKKRILECKDNNEKITGKIGNINFSVDKENSQKIVFTGDSGNFNVTINGQDIFSEIDFYRQENPTYVRSGQALSKFIPMTRTITVINGEEFSESYYIEDDEISSEIVQDALNTYTDYMHGEENELYRSDINPNEEIKDFIKPTPSKLLEPLLNGKQVDLESGFYDYSRKPERYKTYNDYAIPAKNIERQCKYVYSLILETYQELGINTIQDKEEPTNISQSGEVIEETIPQNNKNIDELSDEELDKFIEDMDAKQKENAQKIERLKKIKRAKELIALSKEQDKEIADLESQIQMKGMDINE